MLIKNISLIATVTAALLLIPFILKWPWTTSDFIIAGILIFVAGLTLDFLWKSKGKYRWASIIVVVFLFVWLWAELAVGVFTNWGS